MKSFERTYSSSAARMAQAARDVVAFALACGIGPACRARIGSAASELLDNARRHGYGGASGPVDVAARFDSAHFELEIVDRGCGIDAASARANASSNTLEHGLARVRALCEDLDIEGSTGLGARIRAAFTPFAASFDEGTFDLSELDFFTPDVSRRVLHALRETATADLFQLSPVNAVVVGRLLAGPTPRTSAAQASWS